MDLVGQLSNLKTLVTDLGEPKPEVLVEAGRPSRQRRRPVRLAESAVDDLLAARLDGATILELAETFGISRATVMEHLRRRGVPKIKDALKWDQETLAAAIQSYIDGNSLLTIGQRYGLDASTVRRRLLAAGVVLRPWRGGQKRKSL